MTQITSARTMRILDVTSTATPTFLGKLVQATLDANGTTFPIDNNGRLIMEIVQVILTPDANITIEDKENADVITISAGTSKTFPIRDALTNLKLDNAATVKVELYFE